MKTEQQIRNWAKTHTVHENDVHAIMGYLTALNIDIENDIEFNIGAKKECFEDFVEWFVNTTLIEDMKEILGSNHINRFFYNGTDISLWSKIQPTIDKIEFIHIPMPKYKSGDYVRVKGNNKLAQIAKCYMGNAWQVKYLDEVSICVISEDKLEPATPKQGEFWYVKTNNDRAYIYCKQGERYITSKLYSLRLDTNHVSDIGECVCGDYQIVELRPATEQEKQQLIKAVEKEYNKTFNSKEWVDILKVGDIVIAWCNKNNAIIGVLTENNPQSNTYQYRVGTIGYRNAIKFISEQQYRYFLKEK